MSLQGPSGGPVEVKGPEKKLSVVTPCERACPSAPIPYYNPKTKSAISIQKTILEMAATRLRANPPQLRLRAFFDDFSPVKLVSSCSWQRPTPPKEIPAIPQKTQGPQTPKTPQTTAQTPRQRVRLSSRASLLPTATGCGCCC